MADLTAKQQKFCEEYLIDLNATQAAIRAGYSIDTAYSIGSENTKKPEIRARIGELMDARSERTLIHADYIVTNLVEVANRSLNAVPVMEFDPIAKEMRQKGSDAGEPVWEFDSSGANRALELLGKHIGMFEKDNLQRKTDNALLNPDLAAAIAQKLNLNASNMPG